MKQQLDSCKGGVCTLPYFSERRCVSDISVCRLSLGIVTPEQESFKVVKGKDKIGARGSVLNWGKADFNSARQNPAKVDQKQLSGVKNHIQ